MQSVLNQTIDLAVYRPHERNYNKHPDKQVKRLMMSLERFGQVRSVVVWRGRLLAGHGVAEAARRLGWKTLRADVLPDDYPEELATAYLVADNELGKLADPDNEQLAALLTEIKGQDTTLALLEAVGHDAASLEALLVEVGASAGTATGDAEPQVDRAEELRQKWQVEPGQLWAVGKHRLICGDCTDAEVVRRVMGGEKAALCFTSPPYAQQRDYKKRIDNWDRLMQGCFGALVLEDDAQVLVNLGIVHVDGEWVPYWDNWIDWLRSNGWKRFGFYVWDKTFALPGDWQGRLAPAHEFIFHFNKKGRRPRKVVRSKFAGKIQHGLGSKGLRASDGSMGGWTHAGQPTQKWRIPESVARVEPSVQWHGAEAETEVEWLDIPQSVARVLPAVGGVDGHPAPFSVALACWVIDPWSEQNKIVYEPFLGSGTTMVACENLGRRCRAVEIAPGYVAVALERMAAAFAGIVIERIGG